MTTVSAPAAPARRDRKHPRLHRFLHQGGLELACVLLGGLALWSFLSHVVIPRPDRYLPSPGSVVFSSADMLWKGLLPYYVTNTVRRLLIGSGLGLGVGIPFGILLGLNRTVSDMFYPILNFFQSISGIALLPIVMIWWGTSEQTVIFVILYTVLFPISFNVLVGVRSIPRIYINALRTLGASRLQIARDVILPGALPSIATGARLGIGFGWRAVIAGEMLAGQRGLGWMIFTAQQVDLTAQVILGMTLIGIMWIVLDRYLLRPLEADTIQRWGLVQR